jgi:predicted NodU family carbamoyl transferase
VHGSPIARTATDAAEILVTTPLRYLILGDRLIEAPRS